MDILLGSLGGNSGLGKLLRGKNSALFLSLLPVLLQLFSSKSSSQSGMVGGQASSKSGLEAVLGALTSGGLGDVVGTWVGGGPNKKITATQVKKGLGAETLASIASQTGLKPTDVTKGLTKLLPVLVDELTPRAQVPPPSALDMALQSLQGILPKA
jgi:uncharacterized protein YidB (DUF937 family)